jgi:HK97 family phage prohead protease
MKQPKLIGYAAVWAAITSTPKFGCYERFAAGAFADSIDSDDIQALWQHNWGLEIAFNGNASRGVGSLNLREDGYGLAFEIEPYEDKEWIDSSVAYIRSGSVRGMSVGFERIESYPEKLASGLMVCTTVRARLFEISPVYRPLFLETSVRLIEQPAAKAQSAEPAAAPTIYRDVIRIDPALVSIPRRRTVRAGLAVNC